MVMTPEPSLSSASRAGTPARGRSVTVRSEPRSVTRSRSGASAIEMRRTCRPARTSLRRSWASWSAGLAQRLMVRRSRLFVIVDSSTLGVSRAGPCGGPAGASTTGSGSPTGIAWAPRRTATLRSVSSQSSASSGREAAAAEERRAQHPARTVDADDAGRLGARPPRWPDLADQLGAQRPLALGGGAAAPGRRRRRSAAGPRSRGRRCAAPRRPAARARRRAGEDHRLHGPARLVDLEPQLAARLGRDQQRAEVDPLDVVRRGRSSASNGPSASRSSASVASSSTRSSSGRRRCRRPRRRRTAPCGGTSRALLPGSRAGSAARSLQ